VSFFPPNHKRVVDNASECPSGVVSASGDDLDAIIQREQAAIYDMQRRIQITTAIVSVTVFSAMVGFVLYSRGKSK
jgi:hypothetical protein